MVLSCSLSISCEDDGQAADLSLYNRGPRQDCRFILLLFLLLLVFWLLLLPLRVLSGPCLPSRRRSWHLNPF